METAYTEPGRGKGQAGLKAVDDVHVPVRRNRGGHGGKKQITLVFPRPGVFCFLFRCLCPKRTSSQVHVALRSRTFHGRHDGLPRQVRQKHVTFEFPTLNLQLASRTYELTKRPALRTQRETAQQRGRDHLETRGQGEP
ncbi:hypothetical protein SKAU_G00379320 [Synaphobranchus kaupii]|uniref:Uncharacterized protein n=1 Tax=Synaphobranchus kaupii TaxID=118154 RepID=A0A9Q1EDB6_SYNKA|nr:hypothetical protein SKAU_G00379320 [Synaphobranchus kaupii]